MSGQAHESPLARVTSTYLDHLAVERGVARNTLLSYRRDLARYVEFCAGRGITDTAAVIPASARLACSTRAI